MKRSRLPISFLFRLCLLALSGGGLLRAQDPKGPFYQHDFEGAKWIWTKDLALDNAVLFRTKVASPPDGRTLPQKWPRGHIDSTQP